MSDSDSSARRPLSSRSTNWARSLSAWLAAKRIQPNAISGVSILFAALGAAALAISAAGHLPAWLGWVAFALCIQLRLLCNLMDGMVAVEGGFRTPVGDLWNEVPDRVSDTVFLVAAGMACGQPTLGWLSAIFSFGTAYIRVLGASLTGRHDFGGPMAKPQRMAVITVAALLTAAWRTEIMQIALLAVALGAGLTAWLRLRRLARELSSHPKQP